MRKILTAIVALFVSFSLVATPVYAEESDEKDGCVKTAIINGGEVCDDGDGSSIMNILKLVANILSVGVGILGFFVFAQLGRAAGMHLVLATQKPIVKVITGLIKGNVPSRIAFRVLTSMESRIILDFSGAEKLLGKGDMLLSTEGTENGPERIQGAWTPDKDIEKVTDFLRSQRPPQYNDDVIAQQVSLKGGGGSGLDGLDGLGRKFDPQDPLVRKAVEICLNKGKFSTSLLQTYLSKSHGFVSGLGVWLEEIGVIGPANGNKPRDLLITTMEEFDELAR